ncbi:MAG TPA: toll/interleukin-1 receptor domain-containing protein [Candidatus Bathyarchaeia archaeon]|nr:toll/interleukin-1 receptor domain-containing protein [Candidatus Bathyarchaeia archaeon]
MAVNKVKPIKSFICHSSKEKKLAGLFKNCLENYFGFQAFLAHEDLEPSTEWDPEILKNLKDTDIVIPLISKDSKISPFVNQEIGIAIATHKKIIPVKVGNIDPFGFISKLQACQCKSFLEYELLETVTKIFFHLVVNPKCVQYKTKALDSLIHALSKSNSYKTSRIIIKILIKSEEKYSFIKIQIKRLVQAIKNNRQVYEELYILPQFKKILQDKYRTIIDK